MPRHAVIMCNSKAEDSREMLNYWALQMTMELQKAGRHGVLVDFGQDNWQQILQAILQDGIDFVLVFGSAVPLLNVTQGEVLWDKLNVPCIIWTVDKDLSSSNQQAVNWPVRHLLIAAIDRGTLRLIKTECPNAKGGLFLPLGGSFVRGDGLDSCSKSRPITKRKIRMFYPASYYGHVARSWPDLPRMASELLRDVADIVLDDPSKSVYEALRIAFSSRDLTIYDDSFKLFCQKYLGRFGAYGMGLIGELRLRVLEKIVRAGIPVDVLGGNIMQTTEHGWSDWEYSSRVNIHPPVKYEELLKMEQDAVFLLNIAVHPEGLHERVPSGMLAGAVLITDPSTYYHECFEDGIDSLTFDWKNLDDLPERILTLLQDEDALQQIANRGYEKAYKYHTWRSRIYKLLEFVDMYKDVNGLK